MREFVFFVVLLIASACVVVGVGHWSSGLAWIVAGVLLSVVAWLALGGDRHPDTGAIESADDEVVAS